MAPSGMLRLAFLLCGLSAAYSQAVKKAPIPDEMHRDMYCIGCEMTIKVLDKVLRHVVRDQLDVAIPEALNNVCKPKHFEISEFSKGTLSEVCEHLVESYSSLLEPVLLGHYSRSVRPSYLDLSQQICQDLTDACHGVSHEGHNHDPMKDDARVVLDRDSNDFVVLPGKNLKVAKPVLHASDEL